MSAFTPIILTDSNGLPQQYWACCVSSIGPECDHNDGRPVSEEDRQRVKLYARAASEIKFLNDEEDINEEYLRGQVELAAYLIGYTDPGEGERIQETLMAYATKKP